MPTPGSTWPADLTSKMLHLLNGKAVPLHATEALGGQEV
jgi:hypothetical protein